MRVLADMPVVEILDTEIAQYLKQVGEIKQGKIQSVCAFRQAVLYGKVYPENKKWLDQYIDQHQEQDIYKEFALQNGRRDTF